MAKCPYCGQRKGKRDCPALGSICTPCCGKHRGREIDCPEDCVYLHPSSGSSGGLTRCLARLTRFVERDTDWVREASDAYLPAERKLDEWEAPIFSGFVSWGYEAASGERGIDRFLREHGDSLDRDEHDVFEALQRTWISLFRIEEVRRDVGLRLKDLLCDEELFVRERLGTHAQAVGDVMLGWLVRYRGHAELTGACCHVPPAHVDLVWSSLEESGSTLGVESPGLSLQERIRRALPATLQVLREATRAWKSKPIVTTSGHRLVVAEATYEVKNVEAVVTALRACPELDEIESGRRFLWMCGDRADAEDGFPAEVELRSVRLTLRTLTADRLEKGKKLLGRVLGTLVSHRVDRIDDPRTHVASVTRGEGARSLTVPPRTTEDAIDGFSGGVREMTLETLRAQEEETARARKRKRRRPSQQEGRLHRLPAMGHEAIYRRLPALRRVIAEAVKQIRSGSPDSTRVITPEDVPGLDGPTRFLHDYVDSLSEQGHDREYIRKDLSTVSSHVVSIINFELHRRKTFWVDESLAWLLSQTQLDIAGACLELPFPCLALVFTDEGTLELGESLLEQEGTCGIRGLPLEIITMYVRRVPAAEPGVRPLVFSTLFDTGTAKWPYLIERELYVRDDDDLERILESHHPDVLEASLDPLFLLPELKKLVHIAINAILYSTSAHLNPIELEPANGPRLREKRRKGGTAGSKRKGRKDGCGEKVFFLPGRIPISQIKKYRKLTRTESGMRLMRRFMVRGHWRRANPNWSDQRLRWIEPYWKGPEIGKIIEQEYLLRP